MRFEVFPIRDVDRLVETLKDTPWAMDEANLHFFRQYIKALRDDLFCVLEFPYVDNVYRDSYYEFFASKHLEYSKDCVRASLYDGQPELEQILSGGTLGGYLGYFVIRPTKMRNIGRSMISPCAMKSSDFVCCLAHYRSLIYGATVHVDAFPHSAQDNESMSCAETAVWTIMDYFSAKYQENHPVRPISIPIML